MKNNTINDLNLINEKYKDLIKQGCSRIGSAKESINLILGYGVHIYIYKDEYDEPIYIEIDGILLLFGYGIYKKVI